MIFFTAGGFAGGEASWKWGVVRSLGWLRKGEVRERMVKGEGGALIRPLKSSGVSLSAGWARGCLARVTEGRERDLPNIPSSSLEELELVDPSGEVVGGGEERAEDTGEEMVVEGERVTLVSPSSTGRRATPSSTTVWDWPRIGLKILFLLLAK